MNKTTRSAALDVVSARALLAAGLIAASIGLSACASSSNPNVGYVFSEHTTGYGTALPGDHAYARQ